jgi:hypothetical protein
MGLHGLLRDSLILLYVDDVIPHRKDTYGHLRPVTEITLLFICE